MNKKKNISKEQTDIIEEFSFFDDWQDKYEHIIDLGKKLNILISSELSDLVYLTKSEFMKIYDEGKNLIDKPIFIDFYATW